MDNAQEHRESAEHYGFLLTPQGIAAAASPYDWYRSMREQAPVCYDPERNCWDMFRYEDVHQVLSNFRQFSSQRDGNAQSSNLLSLDPPKHHRYRALVSQAFTPKSIASLAPRIAEITKQLLDEAAERGRMDAVADVAYPLPVIVIAEMLGVPDRDREHFKRWSDVIVESIDLQAGEEERERKANEKNEVFQELNAYFEQVIEERRREPREDLISALLAARVDGEYLDMPNLLSFCLLLLVAGNETTTNLIGNAVLTFMEHPGTWAQLRSNPSMLPGAVEEVLRYRSPIQSMNRITMKDAEFSGVRIPAGEEIVAWIGSANRDERKFAAAEVFLPQRSPNHHLAFGHGIHFCLGAPLARLEAKIALTSMLERLPDPKLAQNGGFKRLPGSFVHGYKEIPLQF